MKWFIAVLALALLVIGATVPIPALLPASALRVDLTHLGRQPIDLLEIRHGNLDTQESIVALNIRPGSRRSLVLNHQAGAGFNLITLSGGRRSEVCVGKHELARHYALTFYDDGDFRFLPRPQRTAFHAVVELLRN